RRRPAGKSTRDAVGRLPARRPARRRHPARPRRRVSGAPRDRRGSAAAAAAPARQLAARVLERVETDAAFADLALEAETTRRHVEARDTALAPQLIDGALRWPMSL